MCDSSKQKFDGETSSGEHGIAALEMAILLPVLLLLLMGILEFGYAFFVDLTLTNAVREGARQAITMQDQTEAADLAEQLVFQYIDNVLGSTFSAATTATATWGTDASGDTQLTVQGSIMDYRSISPFQLFVDRFLPENIHARATMRWELSGLGGG